jgi:hypothetical protein
MTEDDAAAVVERMEELLAEQSDQIDQLVSRIVAELERLRLSPSPVDETQPLVDANVVAAYLNVRPDWVYANAGQLRVRRLGRTLRFSLAEVDETLLRAVADGTSSG